MYYFLLPHQFNIIAMFGKKRKYIFFKCDRIYFCFNQTTIKGRDTITEGKILSASSISRSRELILATSHHETHN